MTGASEQGRDGLLWTIFEGEPFCSRRIASFSNREEALAYLEIAKSNKELQSTILGLREALQLEHGMLDLYNRQFPSDDAKMCLDKGKEALSTSPADFAKQFSKPTNENH